MSFLLKKRVRQDLKHIDYDEGDNEPYYFKCIGYKGSIELKNLENNLFKQYYDDNRNGFPLLYLNIGITLYDAILEKSPLKNCISSIFRLGLFSKTGNLDVKERKYVDCQVKCKL